MKKTLTINLAGLVFNIEEDAYEKLKIYLDAIGKYFSTYEENQEVVDDIESRAAEQFSAKISKSKQVITLEDVEELIKIVGKVEDITNAQQPASEEERLSTRGTRKLFRNTNDTIIAGICSGLAAYFNIETVLVRLLFFISIFFCGSGIILYLILWFIMPEAKTAADQTEMQGYPVTLDRLEKTIKKKLSSTDSKNEEGRLTRLLLLPFRLAGRAVSLIFDFLKKILPLFLAFLCALIFIGAIAAISLTCFGTAELMLHSASPYLDFPVQDLFPGKLLYLTAVSSLLCVIIPAVFMVLIGISLIRRKSTFNLISTLALLAIWIISITALASLAIRIAPAYQAKVEAANNVPLITQPLDFKDFNQIKTNGDFSLKITEGNEFKITQTGKEKDLAAITSIVENNILKIEETHQPEKICIFCFQTKQPVNIEVVLPGLDSLTASDNDKIELSGFKQKELNLNLNAIRFAKIDSQAKNLNLSIDNASQILLSGSADVLTADLNNIYRFNLSDFSAKNITLTVNNGTNLTLNGLTTDLVAKLYNLNEFDAFNLSAKNITLTANDSNEIKVWATEKLTVSGDGYSHIYYKGNPTVISTLEKSERFYKAIMTQQPNGLEMQFEPAFPDKTMDNSEIIQEF